MKDKYKGWSIKVDSWYGRRDTGLKNASKEHKGLDFNYSGGGDTDYGSPILSTHEGFATIFSSNQGKAGRYVVITSPDGKFRTRYLHLSNIMVCDGQYVLESELIGEMGGSAFGSDHTWMSHLHYEIQENKEGKWIPTNPTGNQANILRNIEDPQNRINDEDKYFSGGELKAAIIIEEKK